MALFLSLAGIPLGLAGDNWNAAAPVIELDEVRPAVRTKAAPTTSPPILAPVVRGKPAWSKRNERPQKPIRPTSATPTKQKFTYGGTSEFTESVTIDVREPVDATIPDATIPDASMLDTTMPVAELVAGEVSELSKGADESIVFSRPTGSFRVDESGRLLRTPGPIEEPEELAIETGSSNSSSLPGAPSQLVGFHPADPQQLAIFQPEVLPGLPQQPQQTPMETIPPGFAGASGEPPFPSPEEFRPIQQLSVNIAPGQGLLPPNRAATRFAEAGEETHTTGFSRPEPVSQFEWDAPALCHRPLIFEETNLERHGYHVKHLQPVLSAAHFFGRVPGIPYLAASQRPLACTYTLGHYRPGSYAPYVWYYPRPSLTGTAIEGAVVMGLILAIP